jgi:hypothetical protein
VWGGGRVAVGRSAFLTCYQTAVTRHHRIFSYPSGSDCSKSIFSFYQSSSNEKCFACCHTVCISPAHVKAKRKGAASTPSLPPFFYPLFSCLTHSHYKWVGTDFHSLPIYYVSLFKFTRCCGFDGNVCRIKFARIFSLFKRINDAELF